MSTADLRKIHKALDDQSTAIDGNKRAINELRTSMISHIEAEDTARQSLFNQLQPLGQIMEEVAVVGRFGRRLKKIAMYLATIAAYIAAISGAIYAAVRWGEKWWE